MPRYAKLLLDLPINKVLQVGLSGCLYLVKDGKDTTKLQGRFMP